MLSTSADRLSESLPAHVREVFGGQGRRDGEGEDWKPTSEIALRNRVNAVDDPGGQPWLTLVDTGALRASIAAFDRKQSAGQVELLIGSQLDYAVDMQEGGELDLGGRDSSGVARGAFVPARPFQFATEADAELALSEVETALDAITGAR